MGGSEDGSLIQTRVFLYFILILFAKSFFYINFANGNKI